MATRPPSSSGSFGGLRARELSGGLHRARSRCRNDKATPSPLPSRPALPGGAEEYVRDLIHVSLGLPVPDRSLCLQLLASEDVRRRLQDHVFALQEDLRAAACRIELHKAAVQDEPAPTSHGCFRSSTTSLSRGMGDAPRAAATGLHPETTAVRLRRDSKTRTAMSPSCCCWPAPGDHLHDLLLPATLTT